MEGKKYNDARLGRMCRLTPATEFVFPIHESLYPFNEPVKISIVMFIFMLMPEPGRSQP